MNGKILEEDDWYLLTGATGFLGSHIMASLLLKGKGVVIAGRSSGCNSLKDRIRWLLNWFGIEHLEKQLEFYETDFLKVRLGLEEDEYENLCKRGLCIIHCASDTRFEEKHREKVLMSNVESLAGILDLAVNSKPRCIHYISTAYAVGTDYTDCHEAPVVSVHFTNVYEESKALAERLLSEKCRDSNIPFTIIRPSIVYGDSVTGRSLRFNALYFPVRSMQYIRDIYLNDIRNNEGSRSAKYGIFINEEGSLHLPIRVFIPGEGKINLIPVDYFTETALSIIEKPATDTIYHITSDNPTSMRALVAYTERFLHITGLEVVTDTFKVDDVKNPVEELFHHAITAYRPYISDQRVFRRENTARVSGAISPELTYEVFERCMSFAVSVDWGKDLNIDT